MRPHNYKVSHFGEIDSTNTQVAAAARAGAPDGTVYWADFQSAGRGRLDRVWEAPPGSCLMASVLIREPLLALDRVHAITGVVALSMIEALGDFDIAGAAMKWPNDVLVGENKLAGVLAELVDAPPRAAVVVGFGINVTYGGPPEAQATSLAIMTGRTLDRAALLDAILNRVAMNRALLRDDAGWQTLRERLEGVLSTIGQEVVVELSDGSLTGHAVGLSEKGYLLLDTEQGRREVVTGDLRHLRSTGRTDSGK